MAKAESLLDVLSCSSIPVAVEMWFFVPVLCVDAAIARLKSCSRPLTLWAKSCRLPPQA